MRLSPCRRSCTAAALALVLVPVLVAAARDARGDVRLFRPLTADPRESRGLWRMSHYTEDWRYGTDVTDSTSQGGFVNGREGISWEVSAGTVFRWIPLERIGSWRGPWVRYQLGVPAGIFSRFDGTGILLNTDYQYGVSFDVLWRGAFDRERGITDYHHPVITSRFTAMHHSSHLGDEYIAQGSFGRNQVTPPYQGAQLGHPPVKRIDLAYEDVAFTLSLEHSDPGTLGSLRAYVGGEAKLVFPADWRIGGLTPQNFRSPTARCGLEYRSSGQSDAPTNDLPARVLNEIVRSPYFDSQWIAAVDLRLAKPYNFASADNPSGDTEAWTPWLWTGSPFGREFNHHAGSWRAMVGTSIRRRPTNATISPGARPVGPEWIVALEWYHGYTPDGQLLDQHLRYRPRGYILPSITAHF